MKAHKHKTISLLIGIFLLNILVVAQAAVEYGQDVTPDVIYGSGNANGHFTTDRNNGVEVGLRGKIPYNGTIQSNGDGTYSYSLADTDHTSGKPKSWNFDFTVNTNYDNSSGQNLNKYV